MHCTVATESPPKGKETEGNLRRWHSISRHALKSAQRDTLSLTGSRKTFGPAFKLRRSGTTKGVTMWETESSCKKQRNISWRGSQETRSIYLWPSELEMVSRCVCVGHEDTGELGTHLCHVHSWGTMTRDMRVDIVTGRIHGRRTI